MDVLGVIAFIVIALVIVLLAVLLVMLIDIRKRTQQNEYANVQSAAMSSQVQDSARLEVLVRSLTDINRRLDVLNQTTLSNDVQAQEMTRDIQNQVRSMNAVMTNKKARGSWGEYQLEHLLKMYLGGSSRIYESQYQLSNGYRVDVVLHLVASGKVLCIDSKFPLENYQRIERARAAGDVSRQNEYAKAFIRDVKKHIDDIASKYACAPESIGEAVMFVPSEAIYLAICADYSELLDYALANRVLVCSPTTLVGVSSTIAHTTQEFERTQNAEAILGVLQKVAQDAKRLEERAQATRQRQNQLNEALHDLGVSAQKIANAIERAGISAQDTNDRFDI